MEIRLSRLAFAALASSSLLCGCGLLKSTAELPGRVASAAMNPGAKPPIVDPVIVQARFMRFADIFAVEIGTATREFAKRSGSKEGQIQALTWELDYTNSLWRLASRPQPYAAMFDGIMVITFLRGIHEELWLPQWGEADQPMVDALRRLEEAIWLLAAEGLSEEQVRKVREMVATWLADDPVTRIVDVARLPGFGDLAGKAEGENSVVGEITGLISVDPLSGLEPAVREVEQARQLAERVFYYFQRLPELLSNRLELMVLHSGQSPEVRDALASVERVSQAAASLAATAEALPASFAAEREAALSQISTELTAQREGLVHDIETARAPLTELLEGTHGTADAARQMSDSLAEALRVLDAFVGRFVGNEEAKEEPDVAPAPVAAADASTEPAKPFDISEYGAAAERIGVAARELGNTVATLDKSLPEVQRVLAEAAAQGERSIDHVFSRAYQLLAAALAGAGITVLLVRWISTRWKGASARHSEG